MGLSYLRSNPLGEDDDSFDTPDPGPVDLSSLLAPDLYARRPALPTLGGGGAPPAAPPAPPSFGEPGPQGLYPAQPKLTAIAPADDQAAPPGNDLLSRFASRLGGFGTATTDDDRRQALRQALIQAGLTMASNAGTHGYSAIAPALLGGFATYRGAVDQAAAGREQAAKEQAAEDDRKARLAMDQGRYKQQADLQEQAQQDRRDQAQAKVDQRQARLDQHQEMLKVIGETDPKLAAKLAPLAGSDSNAIETAYMASLKPEKPAKGPQLKDVPSGSALWSIGEDGTPKLVVPAARVPGVNLGWDLVTRPDGTLVRINKNTGEVAPVATPPINSASPAALAEERRKTASGLFNAMVAAGTVPLGPDGQTPDAEAGYAKALEAADRLVAGRRGGALAPGVTPPPPKPTAPAPAKPADSGPGLLERLYNSVTGTGTPAAAAPKAPAPPLNPAGVNLVRSAHAAGATPVQIRAKLQAMGFSPAMIDAYVQAGSQ